MMEELRAKVEAERIRRRQERMANSREIGKKQKNTRAASALGVEAPEFDVFAKIAEAAGIMSQIAELRGFLERDARGNVELEGELREGIATLEYQLEEVKTLFPNALDFDILSRMEMVENPSDTTIDSFLKEMVAADLAESVEQGEGERLIAQSKEADTDEALLATIKRERPDELRFVMKVKVPTGVNSQVTLYYRVPKYNLKSEEERKKRASAGLIWQGLKRLRKAQREQQAERHTSIVGLERSADGKTVQDLLTGPVGTIVALRAITRENPWKVSGQKPYDAFGTVFVKKVGEHGKKTVCMVVAWTGNLKGTLKYVGLVEEGFAPLTDGAQEEKLFSFSAGFRELRNANGSRLGSKAQSFLEHARGPVAIDDDEDDEAPGSSGPLDLEASA